MPKIVNAHGLPPEFVEIAERDPYDKGDADISVTGLISPPQIARLWDEHRDEVEIDVSDTLWAIMGRSFHEAMSGAGSGAIEERLYADFDGVRISGQPDRVVGGTIIDYKLTSVWAAKHPLKPDWEAQGNLYRWLLRENGLEADRAVVRMIFRDWIKSRASRDQSYPDIPYKEVEVPTWTDRELERYLSERVALHTADDVPECTDEERWVAKDGTPKRCVDWCAVAPFCPQYQSSISEE